MGEKKNEEKVEGQKMSYEELAKTASELHIQYQKLMAQYQKAMEALNNREFDYISFFLSMLFKVMEHPNMYKTEFIKWTQTNIEHILTGFAANLQKPTEEKKEEVKDEKHEAE